MNTLNYIGSKKTLLKSIHKVFSENLQNMEDLILADLFAGTGTIGFNFQNIFKSIISNDLEYYSFIINKALLCCNYSEKLQIIINDCNILPEIEGLIYNTFSPTVSNRMFFTDENSKKCDSIRINIEKLKTENIIDENEYFFLIASLIVSIDKVANTSCVYGAFLKKFKKSALKELILVPIHKKINIIEGNNKVLNELAENIKNSEQSSSETRDITISPNQEVTESEKNVYYDIAYLDPPYNQRQYSSNYSPLNYISYYDENIKIKGKTGLIENYNKSKFCSKTHIVNVFTNIISNLKFKYIVLYYNNECLLSFNKMKELLLEKGNVKLYKIKYNKFKSNKNIKKNKVDEYIWFVNTKEYSKNPNIFEEIETILVL